MGVPIAIASATIVTERRAGDRRGEKKNGVTIGKKGPKDENRDHNKA